MIDEVWYVDLEQADRLRRLADRHVRFGKDPSAAVAWATGSDERNAKIIAATRPGADLVVPAALMSALGSPPA
jgi:pantothenate kinase